MRRSYLLLCLLLLVSVLTLVVASEAMAADDLEIFAGQDKTVRVRVPLEFNDARIVKPDPLDPERSYTFSWDFDASKDTNLDTIKDNDGESNDQFTEWTFVVPGTYTVTLTVTDGVSTVKHTLKVKVNENEAPVIHCNDTETAYMDEDHWFQADATDDHHQQHLLRWHWEFGDGTSSNEAPPIKHRYMAVRGYQVKVTVTDPDDAFSEHTIFVNVIEKPGVTGTQTDVKNGNIQDRQQIREKGYIAYKIKVLKNHDIEVKVTASAVADSPPVAVLVFKSESDYLDYELGVGGTWVDKLSKEELDYEHKITWKGEEDRDYYIVVENGYQMGTDFSIQAMAEVDVSIKDLDRNSFFVDIPIIVWIIIIAVVAIVFVFQFAMRMLEMQANKKQEVEAIQRTMVGRDVAVSSLRSFLDNPEDVVVRESERAKTQARGPPGMPGQPRGPPGMPPRGPPRPMGPPGAQPAPMSMPPPTAPLDGPPIVPEAPPMTYDVPEVIPVPDPKGVPAPKEYAAPEIVSGDRPVYMSTEQPKRVSDFVIDKTDSSETAAEAERTGTDGDEE